MPATSRSIKTSHADIAVRETSGKGVPILLIHGNSSSKDAFRYQVGGPLAETYRFIALDLPGHGESSDALDPARTYSMPGYADAVVEVLDQLGIERVVVYGWSLGGHVALEMLPRYDGIVGLMITGAAPVSPTPEGIQAGFRASPEAMLFGKLKFTEDEVAIVARANYGAAADKVLTDAVRRADGRAREMMFAGLFSGQVANQRDLAVNSPVPVAVVNGANDPLINVEYVGSLPYHSLWSEHCYVLRGVGHSPFLEAPEVFNPIFEKFLADMQGRTAKPLAGGKAAAA